MLFTHAFQAGVSFNAGRVYGLRVACDWVGSYALGNNAVKEMLEDSSRIELVGMAVKLLGLRTQKVPVEQFG